jgi:hypothetical protein|tara:strand:- start:484 stop:615 length:132 start_codon:yes stop_codon:yes gene_type:complete
MAMGMAMGRARAKRPAGETTAAVVAPRADSTEAPAAAWRAPAV